MRTSRVRRRVAVMAAAALAAGALSVVATGGPAGAVDVSPSTNADDGSTGSLRYILTNLPDGDQTVVLPAGSGPYDLGCAEGGEILPNDAVVIQGNGNTIRQTCAGARVLNTAHDLTLDGVVVTGGQGDCGGGGLLTDNAGNVTTIRNSVFTGNVALCGDGGAVLSGGPLTVVNSTFTDNAAGDDGAAISNGDEGDDRPVVIVQSTIAGNCAGDDGGAIDADDDVTIVNSTITDNVFDDQGAVSVDEGDLTVVYSTITSNTLEDGVVCEGVDVDAAAADDDADVADTEEPSNLRVGGEGDTLRVFGSVVALPIDVNDGSPGAFNCRVEGTVSSGYNFSDDDTCGFTDATDRENAGDPMLGALAGNGGPTQTRLPLSGSPLVDAIPTAACGGGDALAGEAITTDQRLLPRPDVLNQTCDVGSVEIQTELPPVIEPTFTG